MNKKDIRELKKALKIFDWACSFVWQGVNFLDDIAQNKETGKLYPTVGDAIEHALKELPPDKAQRKQFVTELMDFFHDYPLVCFSDSINAAMAKINHSIESRDATDDLYGAAWQIAYGDENHGN